MAAMIERARKRLSKGTKKGFRGWPVATVPLYGPDDSTATKLAVGIMPAEGAEATDLGAKSVVMTDRIIGCPHEEGIDYEGETCPACPFWAGRDRWTGKRLHYHAARGWL
jgi:hypothetical protein